MRGLIHTWEAICLNGVFKGRLRILPPFALCRRRIGRREIGFRSPKRYLRRVIIPPIALDLLPLCPLRSLGADEAKVVLQMAAPAEVHAVWLSLCTLQFFHRCLPLSTVPIGLGYVSDAILFRQWHALPGQCTQVGKDGLIRGHRRWG